MMKETYRAAVVVCLGVEEKNLLKNTKKTLKKWGALASLSFLSVAMVSLSGLLGCSTSTSSEDENENGDGTEPTLICRQQEGTGCIEKFFALGNGVTDACIIGETNRPIGVRCTGEQQATCQFIFQETDFLYHYFGYNSSDLNRESQRCDSKDNATWTLTDPTTPTVDTCTSGRSGSGSGDVCWEYSFTEGRTSPWCSESGQTISTEPCDRSNFVEKVGNCTNGRGFSEYILYKTSDINLFEPQVTSEACTEAEGTWIEAEGRAGADCTEDADCQSNNCFPFINQCFSL